MHPDPADLRAHAKEPTMLMPDLYLVLVRCDSQDLPVAIRTKEAAAIAIADSLDPWDSHCLQETCDALGITRPHPSTVTTIDVVRYVLGAAVEVVHARELTDAERTDGVTP